MRAPFRQRRVTVSTVRPPSGNMPLQAELLEPEKHRASLDESPGSRRATRSVEQSITELDIRCKDLPASTAGRIAVGSFGVLDLSDQRSTNPSVQSEDPDILDASSHDHMSQPIPSTLRANMDNPGRGGTPDRSDLFITDIGWLDLEDQEGGASTFLFNSLEECAALLAGERVSTSPIPLPSSIDKHILHSDLEALTTSNFGPSPPRFPCR